MDCWSGNNEQNEKFSTRFVVGVHNEQTDFPHEFVDGRGGGGGGGGVGRQTPKKKVSRPDLLVVRWDDKYQRTKKVSQLNLLLVSGLLLKRQTPKKKVFRPDLLVVRWDDKYQRTKKVSQLNLLLVLSGLLKRQTPKKKFPSQICVVVRVVAEKINAKEKVSQPNLRCCPGCCPGCCC